MEIQDLIDQNNELSYLFIAFIDNDEKDDQKKYNNLENFLEKAKIGKNKDNLKNLLYLMSSISNYHHRTKFFDENLKQILKYIKNDLKKLFTDTEIFNIFKFSKLILRFLFEEKILIINEEILNYIIQPDDSRCITYRQYFYPEIKQYLNSSMKKKN